MSDTFFLGDDEKEGGPPTKTNGRYERIRELGSGGMGSVWRVRDHQLQRDVAMKLPHVDLASHAQAETWPMVRLVEVLERVAATVGFAHARAWSGRDRTPSTCPRQGSWRLGCATAC